MLQELSDEITLAVLNEGDFPASVREAAEKVVVILTQAWCHEWAHMSAYLKDFESDQDTTIFYLEYDKKPYFLDFMRFKENVFKNAFVPYLRYYRKGALVAETNFVSKAGLLRQLEG